jgi:rhodanese-related sulfurtransferase/rubrerythrin
MQDGFENLTPEALRRFREAHREGDYELIDVRQPGEYAAGHIPGARFLPLSELEARLFDLPADRDLVFYCRSGARSQAAASLAVEAEVTAHRIYNLAGGMLGWDGATLPDFPALELFAPDADLPTQLETAMNLERGAWRFYCGVIEALPEAPFADVMDTLSRAETAHARTLYGFLKAHRQDLPPFDVFYGSLSGEILEGGTPLKDALTRVTEAGPGACLPVMELALGIEYAAFDLYRTAAGRSRNAEAEKAFLAIAQSEKAHMRQLIEALGRCTPDAG